MSEEIADGTTTTQNLKEEKKFKYEFDCADYACGECDKHPKDEADSDDNFKSCATCAKSVCKDCVVTCVKNVARTTANVCTKTTVKNSVRTVRNVLADSSAAIIV